MNRKTSVSVIIETYTAEPSLELNYSDLPIHIFVSQ